jgi:hypothetical protein
MNRLFRRWFGASRDASAWSAAEAWAGSCGHRFARSRDGSGFVIEPGDLRGAWRLEWGESQRHYIGATELRLRADLGSGGDLQMLLITRALMVRLEQEVFEDATDGNQTRVDDSTPEEMRWLVLYPKVPRAELGELRERFGMLSNWPRAAPMWLEGPLATQLAASSAWLADAQPMAVVVQRGRISLRCGLAQPDLPALQGALGLFGVAQAAAQRVAEAVAQGAVDQGRPTTWGPASAMPDVEPRGG